jgi:broad specificity phosphatase PhoE
MAESQGTVILIRHADVTPEPGGTPDPGPPLNAAGHARAHELRHVLASAGVGAIFVTRFQRSRQTAVPLEEMLMIDAKVIDDVDELVEALRAREAPSVTLVIGHSDTVPEVIAHLGGPSVTIGPTEFDNLFVQTGHRLIHARYGA